MKTPHQGVRIHVKWIARKHVSRNSGNTCEMKQSEHWQGMSNDAQEDLLVILRFAIYVRTVVSVQTNCEPICQTTVYTDLAGFEFIYWGCILVHAGLLYVSPFLGMLAQSACSWNEDHLSNNMNPSRFVESFQLDAKLNVRHHFCSFIEPLSSPLFSWIFFSQFHMFHWFHMFPWRSSLGASPWDLGLPPKLPPTWQVSWYRTLREWLQPRHKHNELQTLTLIHRNHTFLHVLH